MLFKNKLVLDNFLTDGFVTLKLFGNEEVQKLSTLFTHFSNGNLKGLLPSLRYGSPAKNIDLHYELGAIVTEALDKHFEEYDFVANHFIIKTAFDSNEFRLHQDWNVVDENKYIAAHIWCPMQDTNELNG